MIRLVRARSPCNRDDAELESITTFLCGEGCMKWLWKVRVMTVASALVLLLALVSSEGLLGQAVVGGSLTGLGTDEAGAVIPGVAVTLVHDGTGLKFSTLTNEVGSYTFANLNPGLYTLSTQMAGFASVSLTGVRVTVAQFARADVQMKVGTVTERVEVAAQSSVVETERPTLSAVINQTQITQLPFNGRYDLSGLIALAPGVQRSGRFASGGPYTGGLNVVVDGAENLDMQNGGPSAATPTFDSIAEFRYVSNTASAEYSVGTAQLVVVT